MTYDAIIIGSGAGGSAAAYRLVRSGAHVLMLERGPELPRDGSTLDVDTVVRKEHFKAAEPWRDARGAAVRPTEYPNLGGKTKWYGAALLRFAPHEFEADAAHQSPGWPIGYSDLEPYYEEAETLLGVRRFATEPDLLAMVEGLCRADPCWMRAQLPVAMAADILNHPEEACHFDGYASVKGLKGDAEISLLSHIRGLPNFDLRTNAEVVDLLAAEDPRDVKGVLCSDGSELRAQAVILAGGALHSPRLLARYLDRTGLRATLAWAANVGCNYKCHLNSAMLAVSPRRVRDVLRKTTILTHAEFPHSTVQNTGWLDGEILSIAGPRWVPGWAYELVAARAYGFWVTTEDGSHAGNRIVAEGPTIDYDRNRIPTAEREHRRLLRRLRAQLLSRGYLTVVERMPIGNTAHACGTLAAGVDRANSVVDGDARVHDFANLYVADGSVLTRSSRVNPALTIYAWGLRLGARLAGSAA